MRVHFQRVSSGRDGSSGALLHGREYFAGGAMNGYSRPSAGPWVFSRQTMNHKGNPGARSAATANEFSPHLHHAHRMYIYVYVYARVRRGWLRWRLQLRSRARKRQIGGRTNDGGAPGSIWASRPLCRRTCHLPMLRACLLSNMQSFIRVWPFLGHTLPTL